MIGPSYRAPIPVADNGEVGARGTGRAACPLSSRRRFDKLLPMLTLRNGPDVRRFPTMPPARTDLLPSEPAEA